MGSGSNGAVDADDINLPQRQVLINKITAKAIIHGVTRSLAEQAATKALEIVESYDGDGASPDPEKICLVDLLQLTPRPDSDYNTAQLQAIADTLAQRDRN